MNDQGREIYGLIGAVLLLTGVILLILWIRDALAFLRFSLAVGMLGLGAMFVGKAIGLSWVATWAPFRSAMKEVARSAVSRGALGGWRCPHCDQEVRAEARFCQHCGRALTWQACASCDQQQLVVGDFCNFCGAFMKAGVTERRSE